MALPPNQQTNEPKRPSQPDDILEYMKTHTRETISFVLILAGIIIMFVDRFYGGLLVGIIAGIYFGEEIVYYLRGLSTSLHTPIISKNLIAFALAIAFFIAAPAIFLGAAISIAIQQLFNAPKT